ncbi:uracil-DNA glycosylase [Neorhizobium alkalisoli]|uniref:Type-4 uracil-DNA glycosylase n=1 Tax=Neorhizobium alkalisoli TaxID=528178 RepID=A0A561R333_9HYPH|nr:uracil-DNA glycosylase [Neorhizobium alkalisoli]TWF56973.1 DNA polymerase [Neorhizobium alkalisoli]
MNAASDLNPAELAALLHFYADSGVDWLVEDEAIDRVAQFAAQKAARAEARAPANARQSQPQEAGQATPSRMGGAQTAAATRSPAPAPVNQQVAVPDGEAVAAARMAAEAAGSLGALKEAVETFTGCNLKHGARSTVFASGDPASRIMVIGAMPNADDDRDGTPFSGRQGQLLDRMLGAIGLSREGVMLTNIIPWRPPGNRMPSPAELEICRPFLDRQIALADPQMLLLLGNFPARFFFGGTGTIHSMRGEWRDVSIGTSKIAAIATLHPQELLAAPANKALAWQDLLTFKKRLGAG